LLVAGLVLFVTAIRLPLLSIPFEGDEGEYAYIAWRLGHNELPYRDWVDQKPPAIFWVYGAALTLPVDPVRAVHLAALLFAAASTCALFFLARRFMSWFWALLAAALFSFLSVDPMAQGTAANTELFMLLPLILAQIAFFKSFAGGRQSRWSFICGALIGIAIAFKQVAAVNWLLVIALFPFFTSPEKRWRKTISFTACSVAGLLAVLGLIACYFWVRGGVSGLVENVITHNLEYIGAMTWSDRFHFCIDTLATLARSESIAWIFVVIGFIALVTAQQLKWLMFVAGWLITSAIGISASGYFFPHYFQQWLPPLALTAAVGAQWLGELRVWQTALVPRAIFAASLGILPLTTLWPFWFSYSPADAVRRIYPGNFFAEMPSFAERVANITSADQRVFIFGAEPEVLFYAQRVSATRYIFLFPLYGQYRNVREKQLATVKEIQRAAPPVAVYVPNGLFFNPGSDQYFTEWSLSYLRENFSPDTWLVKETETSAAVVPAESNMSPPQHLLGAILVKRASAQ